MAIVKTPITDLSSKDLNSLHNDAIEVIWRNSKRRGLIRAGAIAVALVGAASWTLPIIAIAAFSVAIVGLWRTTQITASIRAAKETVRDITMEEMRRRTITDLVKSGDLHSDAVIRLIPGLKENFQYAAPAWDIGTIREVRQPLEARPASSLT